MSQPLPQGPRLAGLKMKSSASIVTLNGTSGLLELSALQTPGPEAFISDSHKEVITGEKTLFRTAGQENWGETKREGGSVADSEGVPPRGEEGRPGLGRRGPCS